MKSAGVVPDKLKVIQHSAVWLGQTETWLHAQVSHLPEDIESHVVCERTENLDQFPAPHIHCLRDAPAWRYYLDKGLRKTGVRSHLGLTVEVARRHGAGILHSHFGHVGWANLGAARAARLKHVVTFYGLDVDFIPKQDPAWRARYAEMFERVDRILCEGPFMADRIVEMGAPAKKLTVQHLGVLVDEIEYRPRKWQPGDTLRVLIAGSFREKKGIPYGIEALGKIAQKHPVEITMIGDAFPGPRSIAEKQKILASVEEQGLGSRVRMLGYQPHRVFHEESLRHHVFLSPSITAGDGDCEGGSPVGITEMAASGMVIISTTHCDIPQVVLDGESGLLADERDSEGLAERLEWLLNNPDRWRAMQDAGRQRIEKEYNADVQGERLASVYRDLAR